MRLIDADALSEHKFVSIDCYLKSNVDSGYSQYKQGWNDAIDAIIDNAPTVDTTCPNCDSGYAQGYSDGYLKGKEERPTGEWTTAKGSLEITCSVCHKSYFYHPKNDFYYEFCPFCGADMREAEDDISC